MLTDTKIKSLKPRDKNYKVSDSNGLYILVNSTGSKYWRQNYRYNGKQKTLSHGTYPIVTLSKARELRDKALRQLIDNIDPSKAKKLSQAKKQNTFGILAKEWHDKQKLKWKPEHAQKVWQQLENDILPSLRDEPIEVITTGDLLAVLKRVENRGALDIAARLRQRCEAIFKQAILTGITTHNPATQLVGALKTKKVKHRNALDKKDLPEFLEKLEHFDSHPIVKLATKLLIHTFVRTGELRFSVWEEFNLQERLWHIPSERMKMETDHLVPLTDQSIALIEQLQEHTGHRKYVFASPQKPTQPISENAILNLLYRMGYKHKATGHGFRATASTILNEMGYNPDAIERQLAHADRNKIRAAYNRGEYLEERIKLMRGWSNYLNNLSKTVPPIFKENR